MYVEARRSFGGHPLWHRIAEGGVDRGFAVQFFLQVRECPRAVSALHASCPHPEERILLAESVYEEETGRISGCDLPPPEPFIKFGAAVGLRREALVDGEPLLSTASLIHWFELSTRERLFLEGAAAITLAAEGRCRAPSPLRAPSRSTTRHRLGDRHSAKLGVESSARLARSLPMKNLYVIGNPTSPLLQEIRAQQPVTPHDGQVDGPVLMQGAALEGDGAPSFDTLRAAYKAGQPIAVLQPSGEHLERLRSLLGVERSLLWQEGLEVFALRRTDRGPLDYRSFEPNRPRRELRRVGGRVEQRAAPSATGDSEALRRARAAGLLDWLRLDPTRSPAPRLAKGAGVPNVVEMADNYGGTHWDFDGDGQIQVTVFAVSCFSVKDDKYFIYVRLDLLFNSELKNLHQLTCDAVAPPWWPNPRWPDRYAGLKLLSPAPQSTPQPTVTVSSSVNKTVSGGATIGTDGVSVNIGGSVSFVDETSYAVPPVHIRGLHDLSGAFPRWEFTYKPMLPQGSGTQQWSNSWMWVVPRDAVARHDNRFYFATSTSGISPAAWGGGFTIDFEQEICLPTPDDVR